jgi:hypothetical protein
MPPVRVIALLASLSACSGTLGSPDLPDAAIDPGDAANPCGDGICEASLGELCDECVADCGACPFCGDDACTSGETSTTCPDDCGTTCGDDVCNGAETSTTCALDCGTICGDDVCNGAENGTSCPDDCGAGCGDLDCVPPESTTSCPQDCGTDCGDAACNGAETSAVCPEDCGTLCGDDACNGIESSANCPDDCPTECGNDDCEPGETACTCSSDCGTCAASALDRGDALHTDDFLQSSDGRFRLNLQPDCNLVLRYYADENQPLWASNTGGQGTGCVLHMQAGDGNLVLYTGGGIAIWSPHTEPDGHRAVMQDDGNFVVYSSVPAALWATGTCCY